MAASWETGIQLGMGHCLHNLRQPPGEFLAHKPDGWSPVDCQVQIHRYLYRIDLRLNRTQKLAKCGSFEGSLQQIPTPSKTKFPDDSHDERESREHKEKELCLTRLELERSTFLRRRETQLADTKEACEKNEVQLDRLECEPWEAEGLRQQLEQQLAESQEACRKEELVNYWLDSLRKKLEKQLADSQEECKTKQFKLDKFECEAEKAASLLQQLVLQLAESEEACKRKGLELDRLKRDAEEATSLRLRLERQLAAKQEAYEKKKIEVAVLQANSAALEFQLDGFRELSAQSNSVCVV